MEILEKWIKFRWFDDFKGVDEISIEHIWSMMRQGYICGELCRLDKTNQEICGWWEMK